jgi:type IV pilus assembly protein PilB
LRTVYQGHRVVANLFTGDTAETICYLRDLREFARPLYRALRVVTAQRLLRRLCPHCRRPVEVPEDLAGHRKLVDLKPKNIYEPVGCDRCVRGYEGRVAAVEVLFITEGLRSFLKRDPTEDEIRRHCQAQARFYSLHEAALRLVAKGMTSIEEIRNIMPTDEQQ